MRKNGFTLIELLAVIVILAIIALIAVPIVLGIINNAREESNKRSVELYANAVKNGIALSQLSTGKSVKAGKYTSSTLPFEVKYDGDVDCSTIEIYEDGTIYVEGCTVNQETVDYAYGKNKGTGKIKLSEICELAKDSETTGTNIGAKYNCKVDPNKPEYTFYILSVEGNEVNLIMDSNIRIGGEAVKEMEPTEEQKGTVAWTSAEYFSQEELDNGENLNTLGPVTAMAYLQEATKDWKNVNSQTISTFKDDAGSSYEMTETFVANARLPHYSEVLDTGCIQYVDGDNGASEGSCPLWMVDYLDNNSYSYENRTPVEGLSGYWTDSFYANNSTGSLHVTNYSDIYFSDAIIYDGIGVRPVINLTI